MDRLEMARELFKNPKLRAEDTDCADSMVGVRKSKEPNVHGNEIYNVKYGFTLHLGEGLNETWKIIKPKLKEFCFGEAMYIYANNINLDVRSVVTGLFINRPIADISLEEFKGKWTVDGYYEEELEDVKPLPKYVKCIKPGDKLLTMHRTYEVISKEGNWVNIINNEGKKCFYHEDRFTEIN